MGDEVTFNDNYHDDDGADNDGDDGRDDHADESHKTGEDGTVLAARV